MSGKSIAKKVDKGLKKAASKVGFDVKLYRQDNYNNALSDRNFRKNMVCAWSVDEAFAKNPVDELDHFLLYAPNGEFQVGDLVVSTEHNKTFVVVELEPIRVPAAVLVNDRATLYRVQNTPDQDVKTQLVAYYTQLPCAVKFKSAAKNTQGMQPISSMTPGQSTVEIWTWVTPGTVKFNDVLEINGVRFFVSSCESTSKGTKISAISTQAGK